MKQPSLSVVLTAVLRLMAAVVRVLPEGGRGPLCGLCGLVARYGWGRRVRIAQDNLCRSFAKGAVPTDAAAVIRHLVAVAWDFVRLPAYRAQPIARVRIDGLGSVHAALAEGRGLVAVAGHLGSWELVAAALARVVPVPIHLVVKSQGLLDPWVDRQRRRAGLQTIEARRDLGTIRTMLRALDAGHIVVILIDQHAPGGVVVPFFGRPAATTTLPAWLARRRGTPIVSVAAWCTQTGAHRVELRALSRDDVLASSPAAAETAVSAGAEGKSKAVKRAPTDAAVMAALTDRLEAAIRAHPSQWLWTHRRWKVSTPAVARVDDEG